MKYFKDYKEYEKYVVEGVLLKLKSHGIKKVCTDTIKTNYNNGTTAGPAIDDAYWDTLYWEGRLG